MIGQSMSVVCESVSSNEKFSNLVIQELPHLNVERTSSSPF